MNIANIHCKHSDYIRDWSFLQKSHLLLGLDQVQRLKEDCGTGAAENVPLLFPRVGKRMISSSYCLIVLSSYRLIVLVSISTWVTLPGRPLSLGSAGTPPPSWSPVSSCPFYCISSVFSSLFLLGSRLVLFWYNSAMLVKALQGLDSQFSKDFWSGPRSRSRRLDAQSFQVAQLR